MKYRDPSFWQRTVRHTCGHMETHDIIGGPGPAPVTQRDVENWDWWVNWLAANRPCMACWDWRAEFIGSKAHEREVGEILT